MQQWCADLEIPSPRNSASASIGSADGLRPQVKLRNVSADRPRPQITTTNELKWLRYICSDIQHAKAATLTTICDPIDSCSVQSIMFIRVHHASWQLPVSARCGARRRRLRPDRQTQSLGSVDWGVTGEWGRVSWAPLIASLLTLQMTDDFLTPAALMTCIALAHAARACSCMVCFSTGYILPELRKVNFICAKWSFDPRTVRVLGCFPSSDPRTDRVRRKNCGSESAVDRDRSPYNTDMQALSQNNANLCCQIAQGLVLAIKNLSRNLKGFTLNEGIKREWGRKNSQFSANKSLYRRNGAR